MINKKEDDKIDVGNIKDKIFLEPLKEIDDNSNINYSKEYSSSSRSKN